MRPRSAHRIANGIRVHSLDFAADLPGAPIVLLPGITSPAATWAFVAERLAQTRRVVVPDMRGRGLSENRPGLGYGLDDYAADVHGLIGAMDLERPIVIGHSMGARVAARLAATHRDLVSRLVLVDPPLSGPGRAPYPTPLQSYLSAIEAASRGVGVEAFRPSTPTWTDEQIALRLAWLPTCTVEAVTRSHENFHAEDVFPDFPRLTCPTLLVYAAKAKVVSAGEAAEIAASMPRGEAVAVQAGHMIPWDDLEGFLAVMRPFLL